jgi:tetrapyrrole methylase family protein/MazG family protein
MGQGEGGFYDMSLQVKKKPECNLAQLVEVMAKLRGEGGCPWDREQTQESLKPYVIEEAFEVLEAVESGRPDKLCEELGDLLLQVIFHAEIAAETGQFDIDDVIEGIVAKLIRRHPHVFGTVAVDGVAGVLDNWEKIKQSEKPGERPSALDGIPKDFPALMKAEKIQGKAARVGFDWGNLEGPLAKVKEEFGEFEAVLDPAALPEEGSPAWSRLEDELGDILFAMVNVARVLKIHPELALRRTIAKFDKRFRYIEAAAAVAGKNLPEMTLAEMDEYWEEAKTK